MSYSVHAYLTDAAKIKILYESKNKKLYEELMSNIKSSLKELDEYFFDSLPVNVSSVNILADIFNGVIRYPDLGYMYVYIYEKIVEWYGEDIYCNENRWELDAQSTFIPIPLSKDFPYVISIEAKDLIQKKEKYMSLSENEGIGYYDYEEELADLEFILDEAIDKSKDLVIFVY